MSRHFACTACGKCCVGLLPLLLDEALTHADHVPLAMVWTVVRPDNKAFALSKRIGTTVTVARRREVAVQVAAMAYLPETMACPYLQGDGLCAIHTTKPLRCRTMPFYPYQDEQDQEALLLPRTGWACDITKNAPLVYQDGKILERAAFDQERQAIEQQARIIKAYADRLAAVSAPLVRDLEVLSKRTNGGRLAMGFTGILPRLPDVSLKDFAARQLPVLRHYAEQTAHDPKQRKFHDYYQSSLRGLELV